jgi:hypothetical protein
MAFAEDSNVSPSGEQSDQLHVRERDTAHLSPMGAMVRDFLSRMNAGGDDAEEEYQQALRMLRERPFDAAIELARQECSTRPEDYATRWAMVYAAAALEHRAALPLLKNIVLTPIPPERSDDPHASTVAEETIIRTTAVDGIAALARRGEEEAVEALQEFVDLPSFSIRRAAIHGLLASPRGDDLRNRLRECLPKDQVFLLDLKQVDVRDAPQVGDPQRHLSDVGRYANKAGSPDLQDRHKREAAAARQAELHRGEASEEKSPEASGRERHENGEKGKE